MAVNRQFSDSLRQKQLFLMSDNGSQPTSVGFMKTCREMDITQAFASYNNPKGNVDTVRVFRTMKEELLWLKEWTSPFAVADFLAKCIADYNGTYLHSTLGYQPPQKYEQEYQNSQATLLAVA